MMKDLLSIAILIVAIGIFTWAWSGFKSLSEEAWKKIMPSKPIPDFLAISIAVVVVFAVFLASKTWKAPYLLLTIPGMLVLFGWIEHQRSKKREEEYKEKERLRKIRAAELYARYEANPYLILNDVNFLEEFINTGAAPSIKNHDARNWVCNACGKVIFEKKDAHVDHIKPRSKYPHLRFLRSNLQILCARCNIHKSAYDGDDWKEEIVRRKKAKAAAKRKATIKARKQTQ